MYRFAAVARHNAVLFAREPGPAIGRIVMPLVFVSLLRPLYQAAQGRAAGTTQAVAGTLVLFSLLGMSLVGWAIVTERGWRTLDRLRATPARTIELVAGKAVPVIVLLLAQQAVLIGYAVAVLGLRPANYAMLALAVLGWAVALLGMGSAIGALARSHSELSLVVDTGSVVLGGLAGAMVPLSTMPGWARAAAPASPGYWAMQSISGALDGDTGTALRAIGVLLAIGIAAGAVAAARIARGWRRGHPL
ncbi:MAG: ABC transporter permease [Micromonosporaceae bacterium]|nr:ABC transporter permease [Micromonosporaceae bacterium]